MLLQVADMEPNAAAVYCDSQYSGGRYDIESVPSIEGEPLQRMVRYLEHAPSSAAPLRGLIRRAAIRQAGLVQSDEFRGASAVFVWLAKLLRWGNFRRVAKPLYYRLDHLRSITSALRSVPDRKRAALTTLFTGLLEVAVPLCRTPEERRFIQRFILDRIVFSYLYWWPSNEPSAEKIIADCLERLRVEGNTHLLRKEELSPILQELKPDIKGLERSRMRRFIYQMHVRSRMAPVIYPTSRIRRVIYQLRYLHETLRNKASRLLLPPRAPGAQRRNATRPIQSD